MSQPIATYNITTNKPDSEQSTPSSSGQGGAIALSIVGILISIAAIVLGVLALLRNNEPTADDAKCPDLSNCNISSKSVNVTGTSTLNTVDAKTSVQTASAQITTLKTDNLNPVGTTITVDGNLQVINGFIDAKIVSDNVLTSVANIAVDNLTVNKSLQLQTAYKTVTQSESLTVNGAINHVLDIRPSSNAPCTVNLKINDQQLNGRYFNVKLSINNQTASEVTVTLEPPVGFSVKNLNTGTVGAVCSSNCATTLFTYRSQNYTWLDITMECINFQSTKLINVSLSSQEETPVFSSYFDVIPPYQFSNQANIYNIFLNNTNVYAKDNYYVKVGTSNTDVSFPLNINMYIGASAVDQKVSIAQNETWITNVNVIGEFNNVANSKLILYWPENYFVKIGYNGNFDTQCSNGATDKPVNGFCSKQLITFVEKQNQYAYVTVAVSKNNRILINVNTNVFNFVSTKQLIANSYQATQVANSSYIYIDDNYNNSDFYVYYNFFFENGLYKTRICTSNTEETCSLSNQTVNFIPQMMSIATNRKEGLRVFYVLNIEESFLNVMSGINISLMFYSYYAVQNTINFINVYVRNSTSKILYIQGNSNEVILNQTLPAKTSTLTTTVQINRAKQSNMAQLCFISPNTIRWDNVLPY